MHGPRPGCCADRRAWASGSRSGERMKAVLASAALVVFLAIACQGGEEAPPALTSAPTGAPIPSGRIAFAADRDGNAEVYVMNADGTGQTNLTSNPAMDSSPAWSPDGSKIAFASDRGGNADIYVMDADGTGQARLTDSPVAEQALAWSPDGARIAFVAGPVFIGDVPTFPQICVVNADGTGQAHGRAIAGGRASLVTRWLRDRLRRIRDRRTGRYLRGKRRRDRPGQAHQRSRGGHRPRLVPRRSAIGLCLLPGWQCGNLRDERRRIRPDQPHQQPGERLGPRLVSVVSRAKGERASAEGGNDAQYHGG